MTDPGTSTLPWRFDDLRALFVNCTLKRSEWEASCRFDYDNPDYR